MRKVVGQRSRLHRQRACRRRLDDQLFVARFRCSRSTLAREVAAAAALVPRAALAASSAASASQRVASSRGNSKKSAQLRRADFGALFGECLPPGPSRRRAKCADARTSVRPLAILESVSSRSAIEELEQVGLAPGRTSGGHRPRPPWRSRRRASVRRGNGSAAVRDSERAAGLPFADGGEGGDECIVWYGEELPSRTWPICVLDDVDGLEQQIHHPSSCGRSSPPGCERR